jgi:hypothetical protein
MTGLNPVMRRRFRFLALLVVLVLASAGLAYAQFRDFFGGFGGFRGEQGRSARAPAAAIPRSRSRRLPHLYTSVRREANGAGWRTDYPWGQRHLLLRLSELTKTRVSWVSKDVAHVYLVRLTDDALFECPYLMASDVGTIGMDA